MTKNTKLFIAISFTILSDRKAREVERPPIHTYYERKKSLEEAVGEHGIVYKDTTAYLLLKTSDSYDDVIKSIDLSKFDKRYDSLVAQRVFPDTLRTRGRAKDLTVFKMLN